MNFYFEPYKEIYGYYHSHGVELVIHHSDSYAATLVPSMIEMGIDVWQGCMGTNNLPELIKKYGGKISFMGGIENRAVDFESWTDENCDASGTSCLRRMWKQILYSMYRSGWPWFCLSGCL